ncbi:Serine/threonine-protein phosphatase 2A activator 1 [Friedmanniomyces endolithicus]|uniref:Serine/threonine-protein phosphatase 2A activator n=2 Tax=Friedmanniomyces endolithicus TaxID=329885 RepID=A0AAN6QSF4_9PEZI|nr:Serine/threonine-protein phosphatase 2A activator 1 [Friedmanniomyces endolithicus]KAK0281283.1 Serine/threonine-protein phosphatase 2A activator 1 [Friedmanniomyces endolithicus]KAK0295244.1 Serine/threonine-protein phosphatase 2A activator 1 [Friedmanniomyces endolithicus]KAK0318626.1 Serine/threonine-protein phosphatase 2A activator 1 [Friedmanniomyces endolithicus]KAK0982352.1 Serine/threonine-protein phosphatase 2A activator 1 [Friedmanniomyces endolithicus]
MSTEPVGKDADTVSGTSSRHRLALDRLPPEAAHIFSTPTKRIHSGDDLSYFLSSTAYRDLTVWLLQLNRSMFPTKTSDGTLHTYSLTSPPTYSENIDNLRSMLGTLASLVERAPPSTGPRRFGNVAFRDWHRLAESESDALIRKHLAPSIQDCTGDDLSRSTALVDELKAYLMGSFGSAQRLDYGTGHELSFIAFLGCVWKLGAFVDGEERSIVIGVIQPYLELVRRLILTYTLEPAGSHGVWGLDDHSFIPYIFGSAQYGPTIEADDYSKPVPTEGSLRTAPAPAAVADKTRTLDYKDDNMYFSAIQFIYDVKKGPFWEHSPILYDISGIKDGWAKINKGMLKMYAAEVLGKFPVVQHFPFGSLFKWEPDPQATAEERAKSLHAQQQPPAAVVSKDVPLPGWGVGTTAPWANPQPAQRGMMPQMENSTGVPSTRAPWASRGGGPGRISAPPADGVSATAAPWAKRDTPR